MVLVFWLTKATLIYRVHASGQLNNMFTQAHVFFISQFHYTDTFSLFHLNVHVAVSTEPRIEGKQERKIVHKEINTNVLNLMFVLFWMCEKRFHRNVLHWQNCNAHALCIWFMCVCLFYRENVNSTGRQRTVKSTATCWWLWRALKFTPAIRCAASLFGTLKSKRWEWEGRSDTGSMCWGVLGTEHREPGGGSVLLRQGRTTSLMKLQCVDKPETWSWCGSGNSVTRWSLGCCWVAWYFIEAVAAPGGR